MEQQGSPFRFGSPVLVESGESVLRECPVGKVLREAPHIYDLIDHLSFAENATPQEAEAMSRYYGYALRLYRSELARLQEDRESNHEVNLEASHAAQVLKARR